MATKVRLRRIRRRIARNKARLRRIEGLEESGKKGYFKRLIDEIKDEYGEEIDTDGDGEIETDELVDAVTDRIDKLIELPGYWEMLSDIGVRGVAWAVVMWVENRGERIKRRIARLEARLERLS